MSNDLERVTRMAEECELFAEAGRFTNDFIPKLISYTQKVEQAVLAKQSAEIESLNSKLTMQAEAINTAIIIIDGSVYVGFQLNDNGEKKLANIRDVRNATQPDVDAFMTKRDAKKKAEWEKVILAKHDVCRFE